MYDLHDKEATVVECAPESLFPEEATTPKEALLRLESRRWAEQKVSKCMPVHVKFPFFLRHGRATVHALVSASFFLSTTKARQRMNL